ERNLEDRITMYGKIPNDKMGDFWKKIDIYLNFSEFEGTSLSMLEAMSYGCVPVASDVSGVKDFIEHGINGYIYNFGDLDMLCQNIFLLEKDRKLMRNMGGLSREIIMAKCEIKKYADDFLKIVGK
ncbi:MAG: glycosyltransferase family 4 protein, partial [Lachnospiraceae bacterium]|nr:glycosyltransferase family 4 protein [Lachnospiraceae bacterium]